MDAASLLVKLKDSSLGGPLDGLAQLSLDALLAKPVREVVTPRLAATVMKDALGAWLASDAAMPALTRRIDEVVNALSQDARPLQDALPKELRTALREVLGRPWSPDKRVVLTVVDREPMRDLVRSILLTTVIEFGHRVSAPVAGVAKGLGTLARFATEQVKSRSGGLGHLVGAVGEEVERQLEKRAAEFVDSALGGVFSQFADALSDPRRAHEAAELRSELFDGAMALTLTQLGRELANADVPGGAESLRKALAQWLSTDAAAATLEKTAERVLAADAGRPLSELLAELGLLDFAKTTGRELLRARLADVTTTPAFAAWLESL